jgi:TolA-binding protein
MAGAGLLLAGVAVAGADNNEWAQLGAEHMAAGRYPAAVKALEKITPTYEHIMAINFDLAWCYYLTGAYEKAVPLFEGLSGVRAPSEDIRQQSSFLLAECKARVAESQEEKNPERKKNIQQAIDLQTKFMATYPKSGFIPNSIYGRAFAYFLEGRMDKSEADLLSLIQAFPGNSAARDGQYLLANVYSQHALGLLKAGKKTEAQPLLDKARDLFGKLSKIEGNLAMANNSAYALAETWYAGGFYMDAIRFFREVRSKRDVLLDLQARLATLDRMRNAAIGKGTDTAAIKAETDKLKSQYSAISESTDLMVASYQRIMVCFFQQRQFEEARIVSRHLMQFVQGTEQQEVSFLHLNANIEEKKAEDAARDLDNFRRTYGAGLPIAEVAGLAIGQIFLQQNKPEAALRQFADNIEDYPEGKALEDGLYMKFSTEFLVNQFTNVNETAQAYKEKFPKGKYLPSALYLQAMSFAALKEWDQALIVLKQLVHQFPKKTDSFQAVDEAAYQQAWLLYQKALAMKPDAAPEKERTKIKELKLETLAKSVKQFEFFLANYKDSRLRPVGMYQMAVVLNASDQLDKAKAALQALAREYPDNEIAPTALYQVAVMYYEKNDLAHMSEALEELVQAFPKAPIIPEAYFWIGYIAKKDANFDEAIEALGQSIASGPASKQAPDCLLLIAQSYREKAEAMGTPAMLSDERKAIYRDTVLDSTRSYEDLLANYPDSSQASESIPSIAKNISDLIMYRLFNDDDAVAWFNKAKTRHISQPDINARLTFSLGSYFLKNKEKEKALAAFKEAFTLNPNVRLSPVMLSDYAEALKDAGQMEAAEKIYNKIIADFAGDDRALAPAWYGIADIKYRQKDIKAAEGAFEKVLKEFPWYEPGKQGKVKLAMIREDNKQYDEAEKMYTQVWKQERGEARIAAMLGVARCQMERARQFKKQANVTSMKTMIKAADDNVTKIIVLYEAFPDYVSEAMWIKGQIYELTEDSVQARATYDRLVKEYKNYPSAKPAAERLQKLGGPPPPAAGPK